MSEFHYVRTHGPDGGVDAAEGSAIGLDLEAVLDSGLPPFNVAIQIIAAVAEILAIGAEDGVVHGDLDLGDVFIDDTGAVSVEGFGQTQTVAPEQTPVGAPTDRYGLGMVGFALFSPRDLPELPDGEEDHENAAIDAILALNLETLPEEVIGDIQWYLARLLAWDPNDRPDALEAWRAFGGMAELVEGPEFGEWCNDALDGAGERRDEDEASRPMNRGPLAGLEDTTVTGGPMPKGAVNFEGGPEDKGRSTASWTRDGMKKALQRVLSSDYLADPETDWMPGTPIPPMDRHTGPGTAAQRWSAEIPKRAPGEAAKRRSMPGMDPISRPLPSDFDDAPDDDDMTEVGEMVVPTNKPPTPKPRPARKFTPPRDSPTVPAPMSASRPPTQAPARPKREMPKADPNTAPQLVQRPPSPAKPPVQSEPTPAPRPDPGAISPAADHAPVQQNAPAPAPVSSPADETAEAPAPSMHQGPIPEYVPRGPDPFADHDDEEEGSNMLLVGGIAFVMVISLVFCVGVGGVGGVAALMGMPSGTQTAAKPKPRTKIVRADPKPTEAVAQNPKSKKRPVNRPTPRIRPSPGPTSRPRPSPSISPSPSPSRTPSLPTPSPTNQLPSVLPEPSSSVRPSSVRPSSVRPSTVRPSPSPLPSPSPGSFTRSPAPDPFPTPDPMPRPDPFSSPAPLPMAGTSSTPMLPNVPLEDGDSILPYLIPEPAPNIDGSGPSMMQTTMRAHLTTATAARNAVIKGDAKAAKEAAQSLEFINPPDALPPDWLPYVVDLKMEAWLMENSPDLAAAGFKVAQIGQACASCHEGVRAGPVVTPSAVPQRVFDEQEVMKRHAWAVDWMWIGLLAGDQAAWSKGATELADSPFPSVILQDFPEQKFMDLEDKLHDLAVEGQTATNPSKRALVFGKMLATCARCHAVYRKDD